MAIEKNLVPEFNLKIA